MRDGSRQLDIDDVFGVAYQCWYAHAPATRTATAPNAQKTAAHLRARNHLASRSCQLSRSPSALLGCAVFVGHGHVAPRRLAPSVGSRQRRRPPNTKSSQERARHAQQVRVLGQPAGAPELSPATTQPAWPLCWRIRTRPAAGTSSALGLGGPRRPDRRVMPCNEQAGDDQIQRPVARNRTRLRQRSVPRSRCHRHPAEPGRERASCAAWRCRGETLMAGDAPDRGSGRAGSPCAATISRRTDLRVAQGGTCHLPTPPSGVSAPSAWSPRASPCCALARSRPGSAG